MVKCKWEQIDFKFYKDYYYPIREPRPIKAFDTETLRGRAYLMCDSDKNIYPIKDAFDMMEVLADNRNSRSINFFYNLDYDVRAFLSYFDRHYLEELYTLNQTEIEDYKIFYIPRKFIKIAKDKKAVTYFDLMQFYHMKLNDVAKMCLNKEKLELDNIEWDSPSWIEKYYDEIVEYCIMDSVLTKEVGEHLTDNFYKLRIDPNKPYSIASLGGQYFSRYMPLPKFFNYGLQQYAFNAYHGGRFECFQRGMFKSAYKNDIRSAYPCALSRLLDITKGRWLKVEGKIPDQSRLGFIRCDISSLDDFVSPLIVQTNKCIIYPKADLSNYFITLQEFDMLNKYSDVSVTIKDAWVFIPSEIRYPFADINDLFILKEQYKKEENPLAFTIKIILNAIYGKTLEIIASWERVKTNSEEREVLSFAKNLRSSYRRVFHSGRYFNPILASYITAFTRCQVLEQILKHRKETIAVFTDAVLTTKPILSYGENLGDWALEEKGELVLLGSGVYQFTEVVDKGFKIRGFKVKSDLTFKGLLKVNEDKNHIPLPQRYALGLGRYLLHTNFSDGYYLNEMLKFPKELTLNFDTKRLWTSQFGLCADVLNQVHLSRTLRFPS